MGILKDLKIALKIAKLDDFSYDAFFFFKFIPNFVVGFHHNLC